MLCSILIALTYFSSADAKSLRDADNSCSDGSMPEVECTYRFETYDCPRDYNGKCENLGDKIFCCPQKGLRFHRLNNSTKAERNEENNGTVESTTNEHRFAKALGKMKVSSQKPVKMEKKRSTVPVPKSEPSVVVELRRENITKSEAYVSIHTESSISSNTTTPITSNSTQSSEVKFEEKSEETSQTTVQTPTLQEILFSTDMLPKVTTTTPNQLTISLSKTIIRGRCFDKYVYCKEFKSLCVHPTFEIAMARKCALTCDRCFDMPNPRTNNETVSCTDQSTECESNSHLCESAIYRSTMHKMCAKTCKLCTPFCMDRHENCASLKTEGFCDDRIYSLQERQYLCGSTCGNCEGVEGEKK